MFDIQSDIPPPDFTGRGRPFKYPFYKMDVGQSIFVQHETTKCKAAMAARSYGRASGTKFAARPEADGVRIWRVA